MYNLFGKRKLIGKNVIVFLSKQFQLSKIVKALKTFNISHLLFNIIKNIRNDPLPLSLVVQKVIDNTISTLWLTKTIG